MNFSALSIKNPIPAIMLFALLLAGLVFFTVPKLLHRPVEAPLAPAPAPAMAALEVLVAAQNLPAGTILKSSDLRWQRWPEDGVDASFMLRSQGAARIVVAGQSLGANIALSYAVERGNVAAVVMAAPGHNPGFLYRSNDRVRMDVEIGRAHV